MSDRIDAIRENLAAWQEEPCTGGYPGMPVWPSAHGGCWFCDQKIADTTEDPIEAFSRPMILCPECGNKRCPKARWHRNECTSSNAAKQVCDYPEPFAPADLAYLLAELDKARAGLAEAWREGFSAGYADGTDTGPTSPDNPYKEAP